MKIRFIGHPVHPMLTHFPIGLWMSSIVWDGASLLSGDAVWERFALWTLVLGTTAAAVAVVTGLIDYSAIPAGHPGEKRSNWHMIAMFGAASMFCGSLFLHAMYAPLDGVRMTIALAFACAGALLTMAGGWLGGDLVLRFGIGSDYLKPDESSRKEKGRPFPWR
jgi:uncharacterized membrane protein